MEKLLVICGQTATGKTSLAVKLAKEFNGELVSADSRQVFRKMDIGTGKDIPKGAKIKFPWFGKYGYYEIEGIRIWGYDLADPRHEFSISQYLKFAERIGGDIEKRGKLPIFVGGTGLYIKGVVDGIATVSIPKNSQLRNQLEGKSAELLYENLSQLDSIKAASMNASDKGNPRRLIRAIEVAQWQLGHGRIKDIEKKVSRSILIIGLSSTKDFLDKKIEKRVDDRVKAGIKNEIRNLLKAGVKWNSQSMSSLGYRQYRDYFEGEVEENAVIDEWKREEIKYSKRQIVWWKRDRRVNWFDVKKIGYQKSVEKLVKKWYSMSYAAQD